MLTHRSFLLVPLAALTLHCVARAQSCYDLSAVTSIGNAAVQIGGVEGCALRIEQHGQALYEESFGLYSIDEVVPIASATKWLSAAVLMSCVDSGHVRLSDLVSSYLPSYTGAKSSITLLHCFTHTSGLRAIHPSISDETITLQQSAEAIASSTLIALPGAAFNYGGVSMQVAGAVCELATSQSWAQLFEQRIATPLGMTQTNYEAFGTTLNPRIAGGAESTLREYARFVEMLRAGGIYAGRRVLSEASVRAMFVDRTSGLPVISTPHPANAPYGIGTWLDRVSPTGAVLQVSGAGAFGFVGWIDLQRDVCGTYSVRDQLSRVWSFVEEIKQVAQEELAPRGVVCVGASAPTCAHLVHLHTNQIAAPATADFELFGHGAPQRGSGVLLLSGIADPLGTPLLGAVLHLSIVPTPLMLAVTSDATGDFVIPAPLPHHLIAGQSFAAQVLWIDPHSCFTSGELRSSSALQITLH